jgi:hypothetical protein
LESSPHPRYPTLIAKIVIKIAWAVEEAEEEAEEEAVDPHFLLRMVFYPG